MKPYTMSERTSAQRVISAEVLEEEAAAAEPAQAVAEWAEWHELTCPWCRAEAREYEAAAVKP